MTGDRGHVLWQSICTASAIWFVSEVLVNLAGATVLQPCPRPLPLSSGSLNQLALQD
jgi:hypothetical protein